MFPRRVTLRGRPWPQYEAGAYPLDWAVGLLFEMTGVSEEAQAVERYHLENVCMDVLTRVRGRMRVGLPGGLPPARPGESAD